MRRFGVATVTCVVFCVAASGGGGWHYSTDFLKSVGARHVAAGRLPGRLEQHHGVYPLLVWLQLSGRYTAEHEDLFRTYLRGDRPQTRALEEDSNARFVKAVEADGHVVGDLPPWRLVKRHDLHDGGRVETALWIHNCRPDAFRTAHETFVDRRARYGTGSVELARWVETQIAVFRQCAGDEGDPPEGPDPRWQSVERHDRHYQIAAWHFYRQSYLEAAERFRKIAEKTDSPWRALARYLLPRSLARHAIVNEAAEGDEWTGTPSAERVRYLEEAVARFEQLAADDAYLAEFPSVMNQIMRIRAELNDSAFVGDFERRLIEDPSSIDPLDLPDYDYLSNRWHATEGRPEEYGRWLHHVAAVADNFAHDLYYGVVEAAVDDLLDAWREQRSLPYLYLALGFAREGHAPADLRDLLVQSRGQTAQTPGYGAMLGQRLRVAAILGDDAVVDELREELVEQATRASSRAAANAIRLQIARAAAGWREYLQWASLLPLDLPWTDAFARSLPTSRLNRITGETPLFSGEAATLINIFLTPRTIMDVLDAPGLSDYQRSRLANAGWVKAMLADDLTTAIELAASVRRFAAPLAQAMDGFAAAEDKHFEAAWIILRHPGLSPWVRPGIGRTQLDYSHQPASDRLGVTMSAYNWWCREFRYSRKRAATTLPYFLRDTDLDAVAPIELPTAAEFFGPYVIRYARENPDDARIPEALHRVVFATRYSCRSGPGDVSQGAYAILHRHYADSEWAKRSPYWYK